jgi:hypothetical protein
MASQQVLDSPASTPLAKITLSPSLFFMTTADFQFLISTKHLVWCDKVQTFGGHVLNAHVHAIQI